MTAVAGEAAVVPASYLVLRRGASLWGVAFAAVTGLTRVSGGYRVALGAGVLAADEVVGVAQDLVVRPAAGVIRRYWPEAARGIALHGERPLVLIDPAAPPRVLAPGPGDPEHG